MPGVKETKELLDLGLAIGTALRGASVDGKMGLDDLAHLMPVVAVLPQAMDGVTLVPAELADLSADEAKDVVAYVEAKVGESKAEQVAIASLKVGLSVLDLIQAIKAEPAAVDEAADASA